MARDVVGTSGTLPWPGADSGSPLTWRYSTGKEQVVHLEIPYPNTAAESPDSVAFVGI